MSAITPRAYSEVNIYNDNLFPATTSFNDVLVFNKTNLSGGGDLTLTQDATFKYKDSKSLKFSINDYEGLVDVGDSFKQTIGRGGDYIVSMRFFANNSFKGQSSLFTAKLFINDVAVSDDSSNIVVDIKNNDMFGFGYWNTFYEKLSLEQGDELNVKFYVNSASDNFEFYLDGLKLEIDDKKCLEPTFYTYPDNIGQVVGKLDKAGFEGTASDLQTLIINAVTGVTGASVIPADTPTGTGIASWVALEAGTYTNFGGVVVNAGSIAVISRNVSNAYTISQTPFDISSKVNVSDVINTLVSTETTKPLSAAQGKALNEKILVNTDSLSNKFDLVAGKNKFNKATVKLGYALNNNNTESLNATYDYSDFIPVIPLQQYSSFLGMRYTTYYDENKSFIAGGSSAYLNTFTVPSNVYFVKLTVFHSDINNFQIELGSVNTSYESYEKIADPSKLTSYAKTIDLPSVISPLIANKADLVAGKNKFNKITSDIGIYINHTSGNIASSATYDASDFIAVIPETQYTASNIMRFITYYDANQVFMAGGTENASTFTTSVGVAFVRITIYHINLETFSLEIGSLTPIFNIYKSVISDDNLEFFASKIVMDVPLGTGTFKLFLPKEVCVAIGRTIELYNNQVSWCGNINDYHFLWSGVGKSMKRKWTLTGTTIGNNTLTLKVYDKSNALLATKTTTVKVVSATIVTPFSVAAIGDSLSNVKPWNAEITTLSTNKVSFVGTRQSGTGEGRSGATSAYYLGNNSYSYDATGIAGNDGRTQDLNPFFNPTLGDVDFAYYKSNYNQNPTKLLIWLGTNGIALDPISNSTNIKTFIDKIRLTGGSTIPIFVVHTLFRGNQDGIGKQTGVDGYVVNSTYKLEEDLKVFNLQEKMLTDLTGYANVYLVPVSTCHDSEFNFGAVSTTVNPRASQVEFLPVEATHPQTQGYMQIADIIFSSLAANQ